MKPLIVVVFAMFAILMFVLTLYFLQRSENKELRERLKSQLESFNRLSAAFNSYREAEDFRRKKEVETNERVDNLHSGKLSADDILPKR